MIDSGGNYTNNEGQLRSIESVIQDVNNQEDIDVLIDRLQAKKSQGFAKHGSIKVSTSVENISLVPPDEPLDWDDI